MQLEKWFKCVIFTQFLELLIKEQTVWNIQQNKNDAAV